MPKCIEFYELTVHGDPEIWQSAGVGRDFTVIRIIQSIIHYVRAYNPFVKTTYLLLFLKTPSISHKLFWASIAVVTRQIVFTLHFCTGLWLQKDTSRKGFRQSSAFFEKLFRYKTQESPTSLSLQKLSLSWLLATLCRRVSPINTARLFDIKWQTAYTYWQVSMVCLAVKERKFNSDK